VFDYSGRDLLVTGKTGKGKDRVQSRRIMREKTCATGNHYGRAGIGLRGGGGL